jgi:hypothetical protein
VSDPLYPAVNPGNWQAVYARARDLEAEVERLREERDHLRTWTQRGLDALRTANGDWRPGVSIARVALQTALDPWHGEELSDA